jgi:hypothetical protein
MAMQVNQRPIPVKLCDRRSLAFARRQIISCGR